MHRMRHHVIERMWRAVIIALVLVFVPSAALAAIGATDLAEGGAAGPNIKTATTSSIAPGANQLILARIVTTNNQTPGTPTLAGSRSSPIRCMGEERPERAERSRRGLIPGDGRDLRRRRRRKGNRKSGPLARPAFDPDVSLMVLDDAIADRKPEPGALADRLRREKGLEDLGLDLFGDPGSRVADLDLDSVPLGQTRGDLDRAGPALHGL